MLFAILLALGAGTSQNLFAATPNSTVGSCAGPGTHYSTIGAAVTATSPGATISVCPGTYPEQVMITKNLTLTGIKAGSNDAAVIVPPSGGLIQNGVDINGNAVAAQVFVASTSGSVTLKNLTVDGTGNNLAGCGGPTLEGIYYQNTSGTITDNAVRNQYQTDFADYGGCQNGLAINVESNTNNNSVTVSSNSVRFYQKNGITATGAGVGNGSPGPAVTITGNYIVGMGATAANWQDNPAAENGIQIGFGATGKVNLNTVNDNLWSLDTSSDTGDAASGILVYASDNITVTGNEVGSAQFGIVAVSDSTYGAADSTTITSNKVVGTQIFDAIDVCSNSNSVKQNVIFGSTESGVHLDDSCGTGNSNTVTGNTINEACAGILLGTGSNTDLTPNTFYNVTYTTLAGDSCPSAQPAKVAESSKHRPLRPSPYRSGKK
jgi:hypothetical protein